MPSDELLADARLAFSLEMEDWLTAWASRSGLTVEVWALPKESVPDHVGDIVRRLISDVLQEMGQQPGTRTISLALTVSTAGLRLTISDDGGGYEADAIEARLRGRRGELASLGGGLTINGVPGEGTTVSAAIPRKSMRLRPA
uniref:hypothetical protein n=1 Tax=Nonomuraea bangladeshensis TaxID=404385 RepID=UPI003F491B5E